MTRRRSVTDGADVLGAYFSGIGLGMLIAVSMIKGEIERRQQALTAAIAEAVTAASNQDTEP